MQPSMPWHNLFALSQNHFRADATATVVRSPSSSPLSRNCFSEKEIATVAPKIQLSCTPSKISSEKKFLGREVFQFRGRLHSSTLVVTKILQARDGETFSYGDGQPFVRVSRNEWARVWFPVLTWLLTELWFFFPFAGLNILIVI